MGDSAPWRSAGGMRRSDRGENGSDKYPSQAAGAAEIG
jgi:hypothetical protein